MRWCWWWWRAHERGVKILYEYFVCRQNVYVCDERYILILCASYLENVDGVRVLLTGNPILNRIYAYTYKFSKYFYLYIHTYMKYKYKNL